MNKKMKIKFGKNTQLFKGLSKRRLNIDQAQKGLIFIQWGIWYLYIDVAGKSTVFFFSSLVRLTSAKYQLLAPYDEKSTGNRWIPLIKNQ